MGFRVRNMDFAKNHPLVSMVVRGLKLHSRPRVQWCTCPQDLRSFMSVGESPQARALGFNVANPKMRVSNSYEEGTCDEQNRFVLCMVAKKIRKSHGERFRNAVA